MVCEGECVGPSDDVLNCGSCGNVCGQNALCLRGACTSAEGEGTKCSRPLIWDVEESPTAGFWMTASATHTFSCGPLEALPTRWFRFTAKKKNSDVEVRGTGPEDDYMLEVFSGIDCSPAVLLGCNDDEKGKSPGFSFDTEPGKTYWVAVGSKGTLSGNRATIRVDD